MQRLWAPVTLRRVLLLRSVYLPHSWAMQEPRLAVLSPRYFSCTNAIRAKEAHKTSTEEQEEVPLNPPQSLAGTEGLYKADSEPVPHNKGDIDPLQDKSIGIFQRFKKTFKQYGKVMVPVHIVTSTVWFGSFYYAAMKGVNLVPFLEFIGLPDWIVGILRDSQGGYALTAYAMYKLATPARYTVTMGGTSLSVQYLRKHGYLSTPPPVKEFLQDKMEETRELLTEKMEETKERFSEKMEETKELLSERMEETKERFSETKDKFSEKLQETKDKMSFRKKAD
ncbi:uncharacterized protein C18orf19 homolog B [Danio rerio]|uniref:Uncharacterized protein C18orf19 homolog B n=1 Tax=Danio rerio TaxID=7955 RepID=CR19B_DANRE|nr:uncharacterized protein C18orf19 homolog B [Danio rerio]Q5CZQ0.1 RecName: Full=Uncharacterized protein C18orf19 homolog B [Danio rerio]AAH90760.1 Zgc:113036 [Danio rerio]|eukprot:NP_001013358.1 uncharacterized protein C18orf19 homolog B [Danio rerio]